MLPRRRLERTCARPCAVPRAPRASRQRRQRIARRERRATREPSRPRSRAAPPGSARSLRDAPASVRARRRKARRLRTCARAAPSRQGPVLPDRRSRLVSFGQNDSRQRFGKRLAGAGEELAQPLAHGGEAAAQLLRDLRLRHLVHVVEHGGLLRFFGRGAEEHPHQLPPLRRLGLHAAILSEGGQLLAPGRAPRAVQIQAVVGRDAQDPGGGRGGRAELGERAERLGEDFLERILRFVVVPQEVAAASVHRRGVLLVQLGKQAAIGRDGRPGLVPGPAAWQYPECAHRSHRQEAYCASFMWVPGTAGVMLQAASVPTWPKESKVVAKPAAAVAQQLLRERLPLVTSAVTSARPEPSLSQREWMSSRSFVLVLCQAISMSPPPETSSRKS